MSAALLELHRVSASYASTNVLHDISLSLDRGAVTALLGANGAGKTTLLRAICGMVSTRGDVTFDGREIGRASTESIARCGLAHVPEGRGTFSRLSVEDNLRLGAASRRDRGVVAGDLGRMYATFPKLKERRSQQAGTLSGGEQQMLAIARALMLRPRLLLLDEPSFGLAPQVVADIYTLLARINREQALTMLLVEQHAAKALALASSVHLLELGRVVFSGSPQELESNERLRAAYLGDGPPATFALRASVPREGGPHVPAPEGGDR